MRISLVSLPAIYILILPNNKTSIIWYSNVFGNVFGTVMYLVMYLGKAEVVCVLQALRPSLQYRGAERVVIQHLYMNYLVNTYYVSDAVLSAG